MNFRLTTLLLFSLICLNASGQLSDPEIRDLKLGRVKPDTSFIYALPYETGHKYLFIQGANSNMSHKNELSFDFKMKPGSKICAARDGKVIETKSDSEKGGLSAEYLGQGNHIIIKHADGTIAKYWHLKHDGVLVNIGDSVLKGQLIGFSGNTGYTAFPHLHFQVVDSTGKEILPRFYTKKGVRYLRPERLYRNVQH